MNICESFDSYIFELHYCFAREHYVCRVAWVDTNNLAILYQNRLQNTSYYVLCSDPDFYCKQVKFNKIRKSKEKNSVQQFFVVNYFYGDIPSVLQLYFTVI